MAETQPFKVPTQPLDLPSQGLLYPEGHPLASGIVELNMPTAYHEDILTNQNYINKGMVIDKFLQAIIATKVDYDDLFLGDKNAILVASRILAYGPSYSFKYTDMSSREQEQVTVDLSDLKNKEVDWSLFKDHKNEFYFELPLSKRLIGFKLLTHKDETLIDGEIKGLKKIHKDMSGDITVRLAHQIISIDGNTDKKTIRDFVKVMPMRDSQELRKYMISISPDIDMKFSFTKSNGEVVEGLTIPMTVDFFWPNLGV
jgi:hypothetical protein